MRLTEVEKRLEDRNIRPTAVRNLVLQEMLSQTSAFSLSDLEYKLETVDKSTLSRTISLFHKKLLIHSIDDGSGSMKYSVCSKDCTCSINDLHIHFYCYSCKKTFCLESISIPTVTLPPKFALQSVNFVFKGLCNQCNKFGK